VNVTYIDKKHEDPTIETSRPKFFSRLRAGLSRTRDSLITGLGGSSRKLDASVLEDLEDQLIMADVGIDTTGKIMRQLDQAIKDQHITDLGALYPALEEIILSVLTPCAVKLDIDTANRPFVIMMVGINGAGKTTSIGKITSMLTKRGHSVLLAAGDTFRAAASEQLQIWGDRNSVNVISQAPGSDAAAVTHDALDAAISRNVDV
jgi:fused signal recognition particle receptor